MRSSLLWCTLLRYHADYLRNIKNVWEIAESVNAFFDKKEEENPFVKIERYKITNTECNDFIWNKESYSDMHWKQKSLEMKGYFVGCVCW